VRDQEQSVYPLFKTELAPWIDGLLDLNKRRISQFGNRCEFTHFNSVAEYGEGFSAQVCRRLCYFSQLSLSTDDRFEFDPAERNLQLTSLT
jgi:hypothetical protein